MAKEPAIMAPTRRTTLKAEDVTPLPPDVRAAIVRQLAAILVADLQLDAEQGDPEKRPA